VTTDLKCPVCNATQTAKGRPFNAHTLGAHIGGAHPNGSGQRKRQSAKRRKGPLTGRNVAASYRTKTKNGQERRVYNLRTGMAQVTPFKGGWMIVVEGIANPFLGHQVKMRIEEE